MKRIFTLAAAVLVGGVGLSNAALGEVIFRCDAAKGDECAFAAWTKGPDGKPNGNSNFVLESGQTHGLNDQWKGACYAVNAGRKPQPTPDFTKSPCKVIGSVNN